MKDQLGLPEYFANSKLIIFACNNYSEASHKAGLRNLNCAVNDGRLLKKTLKAFGFEIYKYMDRSTKQMVNAEFYNGQVTKDRIDAVLGSLMKDYPKGKPVHGRIYMMFAGHGVPDAEGSIEGASLFCCNDYDAGDAYMTSYPLAEIKTKVERIGVKHQLLHFDCCHAGGIFLTNRARKADYVITQHAQEPCVRAITAVTADQEAIEMGKNGCVSERARKGGRGGKRGPPAREANY